MHLDNTYASKNQSLPIFKGQSNFSVEFLNPISSLNFFHKIMNFRFNLHQELLGCLFVFLLFLISRRQIAYNALYNLYIYLHGQQSFRLQSCKDSHVKFPE